MCQSTFPRSLYLYFIFCFVVLLGCAKDENITEPVVDNKPAVLESFVFEKKNNPQLNEDIVFNINNGVISGELKNYFFNSIPTFTSNAQEVKLNGVNQVSGKSTVDFRKTTNYYLKYASGAIKKYEVKISWDDALAHINFNTDGGAPIISKQDYLTGVFTMDGKSKYSNFTGNAKIKGRGNSTWGFPKKPYKIKLGSKEPILGLAPEKDWVLLANYIDGTHILNAVGMKIGHLLDMPFTNTMIPVELTINNEYRGLYMLTEQVEVKPNRVNIDDNGILLNLDTNFDEEWQFKSDSYDLPVTIKYPESMDATKLASISSQFNQLEALIASDDFPNNQYLDYIDANSIANYLIVYMLTDNEEINHPKSTNIYKTSTGKFTLGPIWDFDWAFAYEGSFQHFSSFNRPLLWTSPSKGTQFFSKLLTDPKIKTLIKKNWSDFQTNKLPELMTYIDDYAFIIKGAKARDFSVWNQTGSEVSTVKSWIENRSNYMTGYINGL